MKPSIKKEKPKARKNAIKAPFYFFRNWMILRKEAYRLLREINNELNPAASNGRGSSEENEKLLVRKIGRFETLEDLKNANLGKFITSGIAVFFFAGLVVLLFSFGRITSTVVDVNLTVSSVSFRALGKIELDSLCRSSSDISFGKIALNSEIGDAKAYKLKGSDMLRLSFQQVPDTCAYTINQLTDEQLSISCKRFNNNVNFIGSIINYDSVLFENENGNSKKYTYDNTALPFSRGRLSTGFSIVNAVPIEWTIGPIYADSIRFLKFIDESGATEFSLLNGYVKLPDGRGDSILLTKLDTLSFVLKGPVRLYLSQAEEGVRVNFQGEVKKLIAGPRIAGRNNNRMPRRGEIWINKMPSYLPEVIITGVISFFLLLIIRQRRAL